MKANFTQRLARGTLGTLFAVCLTLTAWAQNRVSGTVTSAETDESLPGVNVVVKGTTIGTVTDIDGNYSIQVPDGQGTLQFSFIGFTPEEVEINGQSTIDMAMAPDVQSLQEVVVTAVGIEREKKALGYATETIESEDIVNSMETNFVSALSAKVPGLNVTNSSGAAGSSSLVTIRGFNTIRGDNQPLMVIDGIPIDNSQLSSASPDEGRNGFLSGVANSNRAIDIPQENIASVTVLKGAAATALYGSQAGNGAIIITTKRGKAGGGINVNFKAGLEVMQYNKMIPLQDSYAQGLFGTYQGPETGSGYSWGPSFDTLVYQPDPTYIHDKNGFIVSENENPGGQRVQPYNNVDNFFRTGYKQYYNFDVSGANDRTDYYFSAGYEGTNGIIPKNTFEKLNVSFNGGTRIGEKWKVRSGINYINSGGVRIEQGSNVSGVMLGLTRTAPSFDNSNGLGEDGADNPEAYVFPDGTQRNYRGGGGYDNPFWTVNRNPLEDDVNRVIGKFEVDYSPLEWLSLKYRVGIDYYSDYRAQYFSAGSRAYSIGRVTENNFIQKQLNEDIIAFITKDFTEDFGMNLTLGHNRRSDNLNQVYVQGDGLTIPEFYDISNASDIISKEQTSIERNQALYGMLELSYNDYLFATVTGRNEWSTTLPSDNNSFFYPSVMLSFVFSEALDLAEPFTFGKLRGSWARVGLGSPFLYATDTYFTSAVIGDGWTNGIFFPFDGTSAFQKSGTLGDPNLKPEVNAEIEVGTELGFFNNRLGLDFTYYQRESRNLIFPVPVASTSGYGFLLTNAGSMTNQGVEVVLRGTPIKTNSGLTWDINVNFARNRNEVTELAEGVDNVFLGGFTGANIRAEVGQPYGSIFGFGFYRDASGAKVIGDDGFPVLDPEERSFGSAQPNWTMGIRNTIAWKGLRVSALLDIKDGGTMWNGTKGALYFWGTHEETEVRGSTKVFEGNVAAYDADGNIVLDAEGVPSTEGANTQEVTLDENWLAFGNGNGFFGDNTEDFVEDISWVRLREVSLSYVLPSSLFDNLPFSAAEVTVSGRNLWLSTDYTGVDPETSLAGSRNEQGMDYFNMPGTKGYNFSVRVSF